MSKTVQEKTDEVILALGVKNGRPISVRIPHKTGEGAISKISGENRTLFVAGHDAGFPDVIVKTTENELKELLQTPEEEAKQMFPLVWNVLKKVNVEKIYKNKRKFTDFCNDIVLFLCLRQVLFGTAIPVLANPPTS